jgi:phospholipase C
MPPQIQNPMPQVKNIVFLMLENRSLDNVLGWLYQNDNPSYVLPPGSSKTYDGLQTGNYSNPYSSEDGGVSQAVSPIPSTLGQYSDQIPFYDPNEQLLVTSVWNWNGVMNQLFGNQNMITGLPTSGTPAGMQGFLQDYYASYMLTYKGLDILWTYTPSDLPMINCLARQYAVSDRWFCSVPSNTNPNRAYSICGTSLGIESDEFNPYQNFPAPTVFNVLATAGKSLGLYYCEANWMFGQCYTQFTFPNISQIPTSQSAPGVPVPQQKIEIDDIYKFYTRAAAGTLPDFTYLEPKWGYSMTESGELFTQGTDYHPPTHVLPGEQFLSNVYRAVLLGKQWKETLLIVTFDEHGGTYDHVAPPWGATNPDGQGWSGFDFNLFGARVPTILISPFVNASTVFRAPPQGPSNPNDLPFDHTSFIKTLLLWAGVDPNSAGLGNRMPLAPTFDYVLESERVNLSDFQCTARLIPTVEEAPLGTPGQPLNALFEGIPFLVTKEILKTSKSFSQIKVAVERYRADPAKFEQQMREKYRAP